MSHNIESKIKSVHKEIKCFLDVPFEEQGFAWTLELYKRLPHAYYEIMGIITDPDGRSYTAVMLCEDNHIDQIKGLNTKHKKIASVVPLDMIIQDFNSVVKYCMEENLGIAIVSSVENNKRPDALLRYGCVWSYYEYQDLLGCGNITSDFYRALGLNTERPFDVMVEDTDECIFSTPSEAFFPSYVRNLMTKEIQSLYPDEQPEFILVVEKKYAMAYSIGILIHSPSDEDCESLKRSLTWYVPLCLPLSQRV